MKSSPPSKRLSLPNRIPIPLESADPVRGMMPSRATVAASIFKKQAIDHFAGVTLLLEPLMADEPPWLESIVPGAVVPPEYLSSIAEGIGMAATQAGMTRFRASVVGGAYHEVDSRPLSFRMAAAYCTTHLIEQAGLVSVLARRAYPPLIELERLPAEIEDRKRHILANEIAPPLLDAGFVARFDGVFVRPAEDLFHVVVVKPRFHTQLSVRFGVHVPVISAAAGIVDPLGQPDRFRSLILRGSLWPAKDGVEAWTVLDSLVMPDRIEVQVGDAVELELARFNRPEVQSSATLAAAAERLELPVYERIVLAYHYGDRAAAIQLLEETILKTESPYFQKNYIDLKAHLGYSAES